MRKRRRIRAKRMHCLPIAGLICQTALSLSARDFHVAPEGADANPGTQAKPFATLTAARDAVRALVRDGLTANVTVHVGGGVYFLDEPLTFGPEDSGTARFSVTYRGAADRPTVISGGRRITGWRKGAGDTWTASAPLRNGQPILFRQLYVNGRRAVRARTPYFRLENVTGGSSSAPLVYQVPRGILKDWKHVGDVEAVSLGRWAILRRPLAASDPAAGTATIAGPYHGPHPALVAKRGVACFFENALEELDEPGEWYLDRQSGTVTYYPRPEEDMTTAEVMIPLLEQIVLIAGADDAPVRALRFENLHFSHAHWPLPEHGYLGLQAAHYTPMPIWNKPPWKPVEAAVILQAAEDCVFHACVFSALGGSGVRFSDLCRGSAVEHSRFFDIAANAVMIGRSGHPNALVKTGRAAKDTRVADNRIYRCGADFFGAVGIWAGITEGTRIEHNEIYDMPYTGISMGWLWNPNATDARNNVIAFNHVRDVMRELADGGGIYTLGAQPGTIVRGNRIHNLQRGPWAEHGGPIFGLYLDQGSKGFLIESNTVHNVPRPLMMHQSEESWHTWKDNQFVATLPLASRRPVYREGLKGKAYACAEAGNGVDVPHAPALDPLELTVEAWIKLDRVPAGHGVDHRRWVVCKNGNEWTDGHYGLVVMGDRVGAYLNIGGGKDHVFEARSPSGLLEAGVWRHLAMTYDGQTLAVYHEGRQVAEKTVDRPRRPGRGHLRLGDRADDRAGYLLPGLLDEVRLYNRALTAEAIATRHRAPLDSPPDGCAGYWGFNEFGDDGPPKAPNGQNRAGPRDRPVR